MFWAYLKQSKVYNASHTKRRYTYKNVQCSYKYIWSSKDEQ